MPATKSRNYALARHTHDYADITGTPASLAAATVLTTGNEAALFPNSRQLLAGTSLSFDDSVPGVRTINSSAGTIGANPTGTIGLTAVNGAAATYLRSDGAPALSQGIAPTWTAKHIFTNANHTISLETNAPLLMWFNTAAAANTGKVRMYVANTGQGILQLVDDAVTVGKEILSWTRAANVLSTVVYGNSTDLPEHTLHGRLNLTTAASGTYFPLSINSATPGYMLNETGAAANNRLWRQFAGSSVLAWEVLSDNGLTAGTIMRVTRSGAAIAGIQLGDQTNAAPLTFYGSDNGQGMTLASALVPGIQIYATSGGANLKRSRIYCDTGGTINFQFLDDAISVGNAYLTVTRNSSAVPTSLSFATWYTFNGAAATTGSSQVVPASMASIVGIVNPFIRTWMPVSIGGTQYWMPLYGA